MTRAYVWGSRARVHIVSFFGVGAAVLALLVGLAHLGKLDDYLRIMYYGNSTPVVHLANIRAAQRDILRLHWQIFAQHQAGVTQAHAREITAQLDETAREWLLYYPDGVSSPEEKQLAEQIRSKLPQAQGIIQESLTRLQLEPYEKVMAWFEHQASSFDELDRLLERAMQTNVEQVWQFAGMSRVISDRLFWASLGFSVLGLIALGSIALHWRHQRDSAQRNSREHLWLVDQVFTFTQNGVMITDGEGRITKVNPAFTRMSGYTEEEVLGQNPNLWNSGRHSPEFYAEMCRELSEKGSWKGNLWNRRKNGDLYLEARVITAIRDLDDAGFNYIAVCSDITEQHAEQELYGYRASHDPLTGLPNRLLFQERLTHAIVRGQRAGSRVAILFLDLDHFKAINDGLGHTVGDATLIAIASRLKRCLRESDTVARLGGDEFAMVLEDIQEVAQIDAIAGELLAVVGLPIVAEGHQVVVTPSIGVSVFPDDGDSPDVLVTQADLAMYEAKGAGKNAVRFHGRVECGVPA